VVFHGSRGIDAAESAFDGVACYACGVDYDLALIHQLRRELDALRDKVDHLDLVFDTARERAWAAEAKLEVAIEILVEAGQLDTQELGARIEAAAIARRHSERDASAASQDVWDSLATSPKGK
jgi:hypothetical protein